MLGQYLRWVGRLCEVNRDMIRQRLLLKDVDQYTDLSHLVHEQAQCCFVLSTGRCGTKLLCSLLNLSRKVICEHQPMPELVYFSRLAYESSHKDSDKFELAADVARYQLIQRGFVRDLLYVETNNRITFFAPFLAKLFKKSKFLHLVRHPGDFVRSGIRRRWYTGKSPHDCGRIVPKDGSFHGWDKMEQIEKISWLWNETNQFVEDFSSSLGNPDRFLFVKSEDLFSIQETALKIFEYLQVEPPPRKKISKAIEHPVNVQKEGNFPKYDQWDSEQKEQLKEYAVLSSKYGYDL